jgi:hypothetical protein
MIRSGFVAVLAVSVSASLVSAQAPARLRWQAGQVLLYKVEQSTLATDTVGDNKDESRTRLSAVKRYQVLNVTPAGVATVQMSLVSLRFESARSGAAPLIFDSAKPEQSTPELKAQMSKFVGVPIALLTVDSLGRVLEVKDSKFGSANRFAFEMILPTDALKPGLTWENPHQITLEPPQGKGEKYDAVRRYACAGISGNLATITFTTEVKNLPAAPADQLPLLGQQPQGRVVFDLAAGRLQSAVLTVDKEVKGHQGEGSVYHFQSNVSETIVPQ